MRYLYIVTVYLLASQLAEWWLDNAYLLWRIPLPVNVTPGLSFPLQIFGGSKDQMEFASHLAESLLYFKHLIDKYISVSPSGGYNVHSQHLLPLLERFKILGSSELRIVALNRADMNDLVTKIAFIFF